MVERISTFGLGQTMLRASLGVQANYASASAQQSSGLVTNTYGGLGGKASSLISLESTTSQLTTWQGNTQTADDRVQAISAAIGGMIDQLSSLRSTLSAAKSASVDSAALTTTGSGMLSDLAGLMNLRQDGRYLFGGSNTATAPVDIAALAAVTTLPSTADPSYYAGNSEQASVRVSAQQSITYGVTANGTAFEKALRAANIVANLGDATSQDAIDEAYDLATEAMDGLIATQSGLGNTSDRLEAAKTRQTNALSLLDSMISAAKDVDTTAVAVKLSEYETQLQASYSALGKVAGLSLTKYL